MSNGYHPSTISGIMTNSLSSADTLHCCVIYYHMIIFIPTSWKTKAAEKKLYLYLDQELIFWLRSQFSHGTLARYPLANLQHLTRQSFAHLKTKDWKRIKLMQLSNMIACCVWLQSIMALCYNTSSVLVTHWLLTQTTFTIYFVICNLYAIKFSWDNSSGHILVSLSIISFYHILYSHQGQNPSNLECLLFTVPLFYKSTRPCSVP